jgi:hypothetical protein
MIRKFWDNNQTPPNFRWQRNKSQAVHSVKTDIMGKGAVSKKKGKSTLEAPALTPGPDNW